MSLRMMLLLVSSLLVGREAYSISHVGNARIGDPELGFSAKIPTQFFFERETDENGAVLVALRTVFDPLKPNASHNSRTYLFAREFSRSFPELKNFDREMIQNHFLKSKVNVWQKLESPDPCLDLYYGKSVTAETLFGIWGTGVGVFVGGEAGYQTRAALREMAQNFEVAEGACRWP